STGLNRIVRFQIVYTTGASAMGVPGWPDLAACTASIESVRIVLIQSRSLELSMAPVALCVALMEISFWRSAISRMQKILLYFAPGRVGISGVGPASRAAKGTAR